MAKHKRTCKYGKVTRGKRKGQCRTQRKTRRKKR